jgi:large subunit ribosomal protein L31
MKKDIHPTYYPEAKIRCACGSEIKVGSTRQETEIEICSCCHPFYTGEQKFVDTAGQVEKFQKRLEKARPNLAPAKKGKSQTK